MYETMNICQRLVRRNYYVTETEFQVLLGLPNYNQIKVKMKKRTRYILKRYKLSWY